MHSIGHVLKESSTPFPLSIVTYLPNNSRDSHQQVEIEMLF